MGDLLANRWFMGEDLATRVMDMNCGVAYVNILSRPGLFVMSYVFGLIGA